MSGVDVDVGLGGRGEGAATRVAAAALVAVEVPVAVAATGMVAVAAEVGAASDDRAVPVGCGGRAVGVAPETGRGEATTTSPDGGGSPPSPQPPRASNRIKGMNNCSLRNMRFSDSRLQFHHIVQAAAKLYGLLPCLS